jgi:hypothetical protein
MSSATTNTKNLPPLRHGKQTILAQHVLQRENIVADYPAAHGDRTAGSPEAVRSPAVANAT